MKISKSRLKELDKNIYTSMGWDAKATEQERQVIKEVWAGLSGDFCFHDVIKYMIGESDYLNKVEAKSFRGF